MSIVINKTVHGHDSLGMISKFMTIAQCAMLPPSPAKGRVVEVWDEKSKKAYMKEYNKKASRRVFGLSYASFENKGDYVKELRHQQAHADSEKLRNFIEDQVNGGMSWDETSMLL